MERLVRGVLESFDAGEWLASIRLDGSAPQSLQGVAVNRGLDADALVPGRRCIVALGEALHPDEAVLIAVYG